MKIKFSHITFLFLALVMLGCSAKRPNNWASRTFHSVTSRYNIFYNGKNSYDEGLNTLYKSEKDDFTKIIVLNPISIPDNGKAITSNMDRTIEKCRKVIKNHSITTKPKRNSDKYRNDKKYQDYYNQKEFNPLVKYAWLNIAYAEFYKEEFMGAVGTASYIIRHFETENFIVAEARIILARAYAEMGWLYEAEDALEKINENDITYKNAATYAAARADIYLKQNRLQDAVPFLKIAADKENNKLLVTRYNFVLGQLAMLENNKVLANSYFEKVIKTIPSYTMEFNAKLMLLKNGGSAPEESIKTLLKMAKNSNNKNYLDQIYTTIAEIYQAQDNIEKTVEYYKLAIESSTRNGVEKVDAYTKLGDLYLAKRNYLDAHPCFEEAVQIMNNKSPDYKRVSKFSETLGELALNYNIMVLQDSLIRLSAMSETEQLKVIDKLIAKVIAEEEEAKKREQEEAAIQASQEAGDAFGVPDAPGASMIGRVGNTGEWYFYNSQLIATGKGEFSKRWGRRKLEDNWRRNYKVSQIGSTEETAQSDGVNGESGSTTATDSDITDNKNPKYYLAQIPKTEEQIENAHMELAKAMFNLGGIYMNKLEDSYEALMLYKDLEKRYPENENILESYFACFQIYSRRSDEANSELYKNKIKNQFPTSKYALVMSQPNFQDTKANEAIQDSIYSETYSAYVSNNFNKVNSNYDYILSTYPASNLLPKFAFVKALSSGKMGNKDACSTVLEEIIQKYPNSDVTPRAKDILALITHGREVQKSNEPTLAQRRIEEVEKEKEANEAESSDIEIDETTAPYVVAIIPVLEEGIDVAVNNILFDIAVFNFTKFMIKDYDLSKRTINGKAAVVVSQIEGIKEAEWYKNTLIKEESLMEKLSSEKVMIITSPAASLKY